MNTSRFIAHIGNPTPGGTLAIVLYLMAFLLCLRAMIIVRARKDYASPSHEYPAFWLLAAWCLLLLGFARQLNLHPWLSQTIKTLARQQGWYLHRRPFQTYTILALAAAGLLGLALAGWHLRHARWPYLVVFTAILFLIAFTGVRFISLHNLDHFLAHKVFGQVSVNRLVEGTASLCVILAAARAAPPRQPQTGH